MRPVLEQVRWIDLPRRADRRGKLAGDAAVEGSGCHHLIFRTSWVYARTGKNFMLTILRLAREGHPLRVVDDQRGAPTPNLMIAAAVAQALRRRWPNRIFGGCTICRLPDRPLGMGSPRPFSMPLV